MFQTAPEGDSKKIMKKSPKKIESCEFFDIIELLNFYDFFTKDVLRTLLRGRETIRKISNSFREIWEYGIFQTLKIRALYFLIGNLA